VHGDLADPAPITMLRVHDVDVFIQASHILRKISLEAAAGELVCLVGRNGAGKTTTLRTVMGYLRPAAGTITLAGMPIAGLPTHTIAARGVGYAPEESAVFGDLTVAENIELATWTRPGGRPAAERMARAYEIFPRLRGAAARGGTQLSGGERKMLSIARALALDPTLLLLDEPASGLSDAEMSSLGDRLRTLGQRMAVLLVEHHMDLVMSVCDRIVVLDFGRVIATGGPERIRSDPAVTEAYLGEEISDNIATGSGEHA